MNWDRIEGNWKEFRGKAKTAWGKLTDDDLDVIEGRRDELQPGHDRLGVCSIEDGPAIPVMPTPISTADRSRIPDAIARATGSLTAPCRSMTSPGTPSSSRLAAFE